MRTNDVSLKYLLMITKILDFKDIIVKSAVKKCDNPEHETGNVYMVCFYNDTEIRRNKKTNCACSILSKCNCIFRW